MLRFRSEHWIRRFVRSCSWQSPHVGHCAPQSNALSKAAPGLALALHAPARCLGRSAHGDPRLS